MKLSLVIPCYNESENVIAFQKAAMNAFNGCGYEYELIFVDDGSRDTTLFNLKKLYAQQACPMKVIALSRNFGKEAALYAGLQHAEGEFICFIDADLQQQPSLVLEMVDILKKSPEYDVVAACQDRRGESKLLSLLKKGFYATINRLSDVSLQSHASDFRTFRKCVAESILSMGEYHRFSKGIFAWVGYSTCYIPYTASRRNSGASKWSLGKLISYAVEGIIGFSTKPLRLATYTGTVTAIAALIYLVFVVLEKLTKGIDIPGYATIIVLILLLGGIQLLCIGIIGEYVGKIFEQSKDRPIYIAKEILEHKKTK